MPRALREYYAKVGKHPLNQAYNRLLELPKLDIADDHLVFLDENQSVALWGVPRSHLAEDNPIVWQGENGKPIVWQSENLSVSEFLEINLYWQAACGGLKYSGSATELDVRVVALLEQHWPNVKTHNKMRFFVKSGQVLVLNDEGAGVFSLLAAGTTLADFEAIDEQLCVEWDWSILDELEEAEAANDEDEEDEEDEDEDEEDEKETESQ
jgi:hypothetical protein